MTRPTHGIRHSCRAGQMACGAPEVGAIRILFFVQDDFQVVE
jgi:hypothetical protein